MTREEMHNRVWSLYAKNPNPRIEVVEQLVASLITEAEDKAWDACEKLFAGYDVQYNSIEEWRKENQ